MKRLSITLLIFLGFTLHITAQTANWSVNVNDYQYSMSLTAFLAVDGEILTNNGDRVAVFSDDDVCRGVTNLIYIEAVDRYLAYLTIYSNSNSEELSFKIYDSTSDEVIDVTETITFAIDEHYGDVFQSYSIAEPLLSTETELEITSFSETEIISSSTVEDTLKYVLEFGTDVSSLTPTFTLSEGANLYQGRQQVNALNGKTIDFTNPMSIDVMSADQSNIESYVIKVELESREIAEEPDWSVDPTNFAYSMNFIGKVKINGEFSNDPYTKIGAFVNGESRGEAKLSYDENYDDYFVFLGVSSNEISGEDIEFKIWDALAGKSLNASIDEAESIEFISDQVIGFISSPAVFENTDVIQQQVVLNEGWTWVSFFVEQSAFSNVTTLTENLDLSNSDRVHSQVYFDVYDSLVGWTGTLSTYEGLQPNQMYKMKIEKENVLAIDGSELDAEGLEFEVKSGWNWLAYPLARNMDVNEALVNLDATNGDILKSQSAFAVYDEFRGWTGSLHELEHGVGYMLKSQNEQTFTYPVEASNARSISHQNAKFEISKTEFVLPQFQDNMNAIVMVDYDVDRVLIMDEQGEIRGMSITSMVKNKNYAFITIFGEQSEKLRYFVEKNGVKVEIDLSLQFSVDNLLGDLTHPVDLRQDIITDELNVYPIPFDKTLSVTVGYLKDETAKVDILDLNGKVLFTEEHLLYEGTNKWDLNLELNNGIYLLHITTPSTTFTKRIVK